VNANEDVKTITGSNEYLKHIWRGQVIRGGTMVPVIKEEAEKDPNVLAVVGRYIIANPDLIDRRTT
jgi:hypothetical protein